MKRALAILIYTLWFLAWCLLPAFYPAAVALLFCYFIPGIMLWGVCGFPPIAYRYVKRIIFAWPLLLLCPPYYRFYMRQRDRELTERYDEIWGNK